MKVKLRLDKATIQEFLIQNVEKIVFGFLTLAFLFMVYSAVTGKRFDKTREQLIGAVEAGQRRLNETPPKTGLTVPDYDAQAKQTHTTILEKPYSEVVVWDKEIFDKPEGRDRPALIAVEGLRGAAEVGRFRVTVERAPRDVPAAPDRGRPGRPPDPMPGAGGSETRGKQWVVITGLVPLEKQELAFEELRTAAPAHFEPSRDYPDYLGYSVQRVEVVSPADAANPNWDKAETIKCSKALAEAKKEWNQQQFTDAVAQQYLLQRNPENIAFPLGPLDGAWGESVAHAPEIPLNVNRPGGMPGGMPMPMGDFRRSPPATGGRPLGPGAPPGGDDNPYSDNEDKPPAPGKPPPDAAPNAQAGGHPPNLLFRFFDFNVASGKHYVYRVQLALRNPNQHLKAAWLKDPKLADEPYLTTKWSDPTPMISVPSDTRILAVSVKPGHDPSGHDVSGRIVVTKWSRQKGVEAHKEFTVVRGQVANFSDTFTPPTNMPGAGGMPPAMMMGAGPGGHGAGGYSMPPPAAGGRGAPALPPARAPRTPVAGVGRPFKVNYFTHAIALDFRGGDRLRGRKSYSLQLAAPGKILMLDSDGNLVVHDELDDKPTCDQINGADATAVADESAVPRGVRGGEGGHGGALDNLLNPGATPRKRPTGHGGP